MKRYKIFLEDEIEEYHLLDVIQRIYPFGCYIYAVVDEEHLHYILQPFIRLATFKQGIFRSKKKVIIFMHDLYFEKVHYFYEMYPFIRFVFTDKEIGDEYLEGIEQKQQFIKNLRKKKVSHVSMSSNAEWINYYQY